jgi:energy-coupling factor transporter transmembrane protein EcfT
LLATIAIILWISLPVTGWSALAFLFVLGMHGRTGIRQRSLGKLLYAVAGSMLPFAVYLWWRDGWEGGRLGAKLLLRGWGVCAWAHWLICRLNMTELLLVLRQLKVPRRWLSAIWLAHFALKEQRIRFQRARLHARCRGFQMQLRPASMATAGRIVALQVVRGQERAVRVQKVLRCRGFQGEMHVGSAPAGASHVHLPLTLVCTLHFGLWVIGRP